MLRLDERRPARGTASAVLGRWNPRRLGIVHVELEARSAVAVSIRTGSHSSREAKIRWVRAGGDGVRRAAVSLVPDHESALGRSPPPGSDRLVSR
jgi:hypothetical protein